MFLERLFNQTNSPELEQMVKFTEARHKLLADNIVNIDTPGYQPKDLSLDAFQQMLGNRIQQTQRRPLRRRHLGTLALPIEQRHGFRHRPFASLAGSALAGVGKHPQEIVQGFMRFHLPLA